MSRNNESLDKFEAIQITLPAPKTTIKTTIPISDISVIDSRFDTSCIGMMQILARDHVTIVNCKRPTSIEIKDFFYQLIPIQKRDTNGIELSCFIKKLMLTDKIYLDPETGETTDEKVYNTREKSGILLVIEFYAHKDGMYIPLFRFDSTMIGEKNIVVAAREYLSDALIKSLNKLGTINWELKNINGRRIPESSINEYYKDRLDLPIFSSVPKKGIYRSFEDFKNNTPQQIEFTVVDTKKSDFLYIKNEKGEDELLTDLWGYCDGKDMFIFSANNFFKLYRHENIFRIYGAKDYTSKRVLRMNFRAIDAIIPKSNFSKGRTKTKYELVKRLYQVDMETGELF